jgi:hypothetical protein
MSSGSSEEHVPGAEDALMDERKLTGWVLAAHGHGPDWERALGLGIEDAAGLAKALRAHVREHAARPTASAATGPAARKYRVYGPLEVGGRQAWAVSVWVVAEPGTSPRLITAYPRRRGRR